MPRPEDVDLDLVLKDPKAARQWIKDFHWGVGHAPEIWVIDMENAINLKSMNDREAVAAALSILDRIERPLALKDSAICRECNELM